MGLDIVELVLAVEERFGIEVLDIDAEKVETVGELQELILKRMQRTTEAPPAASEVWSVLQEILVEQFGIPPGKVKPEAKLVADLGLD